MRLFLALQQLVGPGQGQEHQWPSTQRSPWGAEVARSTLSRVGTQGMGQEGVQEGH